MTDIIRGCSLKDLKASFDSLKAAYDASREVIEDLNKAKSWAEDSLRGLYRILFSMACRSDVGSTVLNDAGECTRATEMKAVMREMQDELVACGLSLLLVRLDTDCPRQPIE